MAALTIRLMNRANPAANQSLPLPSMSPDTTVDEKARAPKRRIKVGDVILIPLPDGRYGYAHHLHKRPHDPQTGLVWLIQVLDRMSEEPFPVDAVAGARPLFPPVFVALPPMVQHGRWKVIGHVPVEGFVFPRFRNSRGIVSGLRHDWEIWDGQKTTFIGDLPPELRSLEMPFIYGAVAIEERVVSGRGEGDYWW